MNWYLKVLRNYANFSGRARRKEYWMFFLFNIIFSSLSITIDRTIGTDIAEFYGYLSIIYLVVLFVPSLAVVVRRLHDIGKSGGMILIALIPLIGGIWLLILMTKEGEEGENKYGTNPKAEGLS